jgi:hypothetical protein
MKVQFPGIYLRMEAEVSSETSVSVYRIARRHILDEDNVKCFSHFNQLFENGDGT